MASTAALELLRRYDPARGLEPLGAAERAGLLRQALAVGIPAVPGHSSKLAGGRTLGRLRSRPRLALVIALGAVVILGAGAAVAHELLGPSPGFSAGFSAFEKLPPVTSPLPGGLPARFGGYEPGGWRRLQTGLAVGSGELFGHPNGSLYGYLGADGSFCLLLSGRGGNCSPAVAAARDPGVFANIYPGYPAALGKDPALALSPEADVPAMAAIVADSVRSVTLTVGSRTVAPPIVNNSVVVGLSDLEPNEPITLDVTYDDATCLVFPLINPRGDAGWQTESLKRGAPC